MRWLAAACAGLLILGTHAKTLRHAFLNAETAFDPHATSDLYSNTINDATATVDFHQTFDFQHTHANILVG